MCERCTPTQDRIPTMHYDAHKRACDTAYKNLKDNAPWMPKFPCCALDIMSHVFNGTSKESIMKALALSKPFDTTTVMCFTIPGEEELEETLEKCGFKHITDIRRRRTMGEGPVKMWLRDIGDIPKPPKPPKPDEEV